MNEESAGNIIRGCVFELTEYLVISGTDPSYAFGFEVISFKQHSYLRHIGGLYEKDDKGEFSCSIDCENGNKGCDTITEINNK
ncbi:MAG: hypothetical protein JWN76_1060 [Chitinophagaceae bacterium]|nr:hypothetical protein [Chitinophagaceae bacterium]